MDGVDAALVDMDTHRCLAGITRPYGAEARQFLNDVLNGQSLGLGTLSQLSTVLGREFALSVQQLLDTAECSAQDVIAIGSHGQTLCHDASAAIPYTVQLGCPHTIAEMTGIPVVADFRTRDLVLGGQGAPFAPLIHQVLFQHREAPMAVINIGGIANITFLDDSTSAKGYDVGPGNCLMDAFIQMTLNQPYDDEGAWASRGVVIEPLLAALLSDPFFQLRAPKSIGKEYFSIEWLLSHVQSTHRPEDIQATLLELTARTLVREVERHAIRPISVVLCGGGVHNRALHRAFQHHMGETPVLSSAHFGLDPDYIEALLFAWLADKALQGTALDLQTLTGARKPSVLGVIYLIKDPV